MKASGKVNVHCSVRNNKGFFSLFTIFIIFCFSFFNIINSGCIELSDGGGELEKITLQLNWEHDAEFSGFYMARELGFYEEYGIDIEINSLLPDELSIDYIRNGSADFSVLGFEELLLYENLEDLRAIFAAYQINPEVFISMVDSGINSPLDMEGKRILIKNEFWYNSFIQMMNNAGADPYKSIIINISDIGGDPYDMNYFFNGTVDVWSGYIHSEPVEAEINGFDVNLILPFNYGKMSYQGILAANYSFINSNNKLVNNFISATIRGWEAALSNPGYTAEVVTLYSRHDFDFNMKAMEFISSFVYEGKYPLGWIDVDRISNYMEVERFPDGEPETVVDMSFIEDYIHGGQYGN